MPHAPHRASYPPACPQVKASHPRTPLTLYANGSGGLLERMAGTGADVIGLDWTVDMADARRRLGPNQAVQVSAAGGRQGRLRAAMPAGSMPLPCWPCWPSTALQCQHAIPSPPSLTPHHPQGNVDPVVMFGGEAAIEAAVRDCLTKAGPRGHVLNLGHGVLVGTPEESVAHMFNLSKSMTYASLGLEQRSPASV